VTKDSFEALAKAMVEANGDAAVRAFVRTQTFGQIASAMIKTDEDHAIAAFSLALRIAITQDASVTMPEPTSGGSGPV
jgi:pyruvate/2-oxoglutarate dehydrogenase complex dihydrolipoamide dehydrogenase (E3) component